MSKWSAFKIFLAGWDALQNEPNFMLVCYSIVELLMVFEVSAQHEHTITDFKEGILMDYKYIATTCVAFLMTLL